MAEVDAAGDDDSATTGAEGFPCIDGSTSVRVVSGIDAGSRCFPAGSTTAVGSNWPFASVAMLDLTSSNNALSVLVLASPLPCSFGIVWFL